MLTFKQDFKSFWQYIKYPTMTPRMSGRRGSGWWSDFKLYTPFKHLLKWLFFLWAINLFVLAPIAAGIADSLGASHRLDLRAMNLMLFLFFAAVWAPLTEELVFRFCLRRPRLILIYLPAMIYVFMLGAKLMSAVIVMVLLGLFIILDVTRQTTAKQAMPFKWRRLYVECFPIIFHAAVLVFAGVHLMNYEFKADATSLLLPLLILPQWLTGMVISWMRMRDGFACAVVMHALFNGVPALLLVTIFSLVPADLVLSFIF